MMSRFPIFVAAMLLSASSLVSQSPDAQQASSNPTNTPTIRVNTEEVNLDMVFHDKKGRAIHDIRSEQVHVYEDGVEQQLNSFKYLDGEKNAPSSAPAAAATTGGSIPLDPMREVRLVTLVFEGLDPEGKRFFHQALQDVLKMAPEQNLYFSVMVVDEKLHMIQPFTNDRAEILKTVEKSEIWQFIQFQENSAAIKADLARTVSAGEPTLTSSGNSAPSQNAIASSINYRMAKMEYDMLQQADAANRQADARGTIDALLALVKAESQLPGRKVVLYFNPGLFIPEVAKEQYGYMISAANRGNITFYTVDPKGLVASSQSGSGGQYTDASADKRDLSSTAVGQLGNAAGETRNLAMNGGRGEVSTAQVRAQENAENGIRSNPLLWLRDLSQQTGGLTIAETNDLNAPLREVMDDVRSYYEASYTPHISTLDGKFRHISVKVDRPGIEVKTRSGYFALPQLTEGQHLLAYEVPLMNAVSAATSQTDVSFNVGAERFNGRGPKIEYELTIEAPMKGITFAPEPGGKNAAIDVTELSVVKNSSGEVVAKFSKEFPVQVPLKSVDSYKEGNLVQTFRAELAPGNYTLETAVMDRKDNRIGVKKTPLVVPDSSDKLAISDVVVIRRTEPIKDTAMLDAFYFPGGKIVPTLNSTLKGGAGSVLPFYFTVYPDPAVKDAPKLTMGFYKDGQYLGSAEAPLPPMQKDGRIPYIANLPADKFTPGSYEIRLNVTQGQANADEKVDFQVN
jgi:VWFA-related protein